MSVFGRRASRLAARQRAIAATRARAAGTPVEVQRLVYQQVGVPITQRVSQVANVLTNALRAGETTGVINVPRPTVSHVESGVPPARATQFSTKYLQTGPCAPGFRKVMAGTRSESCVPIPSTAMYAVKGAKVPTAVANGIRAAEARPSQTGIGPQQPDASFLKGLFTTGLERLLGPASTPTRAPSQPGVQPSSDGRMVAEDGPAFNVQSLLIPAALIGGFLLLRR